MVFLATVTATTVTATTITATTVAAAAVIAPRPAAPVRTEPPAAAVETLPTGAWPLQPEPAVVEPFDPPAVSWGAGHRGVDLAGTVGQGVRAALPGTISFAGRIAGRGVVVVDHGATRTTYEPVSPAVAVGDLVGRAGHLGTLELHGSHCAPAACLHWGLREGETYLDPLSLVGAGPRPVRLLPLG